MAKKLDHREYQCELIKVVDGDTIDCYIDLGFNLKTKKRIRYRNKHLLEQGVFKLKSFGTGKFGRVLGEIFVDPEVVGEHITECIGDAEHHIDIDESGWVSVNDILIEEGHAYEYHGEKKKDFETEMAKEKAAAFEEKSEV
jgi:endonuclease YncB( thermonuclease family)